MGSKYSEEEINWIKENIKTYKTYEELAKEVNELFNTNRNPISLQKKCSKLELRNKNATKEQEKWITDNCFKYKLGELTKLFNSQFNENKTNDAIHKLCRRLNIDHIDSRLKYKIGDERFGYKNANIVVKIGEDEWKRKDFIEWEKYNPPIKRDGSEELIHLDGYIENCDIDNLYLIKGSCYIRHLNESKILEEHNKYLTLSIIKTMEFNSLIRNKNKKFRINWKGILNG